MSLLKRLFGKSMPTPAATTAFTAPLAPETPVFVIGDLHGCQRHLTQLQTLMQAKDPDAPQVYVGDYVDRGEQSLQVLQTLYARRDDPMQICLRGNHEDMMLSFLRDPAEKGARWLRYGGLNTLGSCGIAGLAPTKNNPETLIATADKLREALGADLSRGGACRSRPCLTDGPTSGSDPEMGASRFYDHPAHRRHLGRPWPHHCGSRHKRGKTPFIRCTLTVFVED